MDKLIQYIKECRKLGAKDKAIKDKLLANKYPKKHVDKAFLKVNLRRYAVLGLLSYIVLFLVIIIIFNQGGFVGRLTDEVTFNHEEIFNMTVDSNQSIIWLPRYQGELISLRINGEINGTGELYLVTDNSRYLIYKTGQADFGLLSGNVIASDNMTLDEPIQNLSINASINESFIEEENNTNESLVDTSVTTLNETNVSQLENVSIEIPDNATSQLNESINESTINETIDSTQNSTENVSAEINQTTQVNETTQDEIIIPILSSSFTLECVETCLLPNLNYTNYTLEVIVDGSLYIDSVSYQMREVIELDDLIENVSENITIDTNVTNTINLSINQSINSTTNQTFNTTSLNITNGSQEIYVTSTPVEIGKPVVWTVDLDTNVYSNFTIPGEAYNISEDAFVEYNGNRVESLSFNKEKKEKDKIQTKAKKKKPKKVNLVFKEKKPTRIKYTTPGPTKEEKVLGNNKKIVTIGSEIGYTDVAAYTDIPEAHRENIILYWMTDTGKRRVNPVMIDTNDNGFIDRLEWTVPHLSNQSYEITINILTVQSYPTVGGFWTVRFTTTGTADLVIDGHDGTLFGYDIEHHSLKCGGETLEPVYNGTTVYYPDYECADIGYHTVSVWTSGKHTQRFTFGNATGFAYNLAGNLPKTMNIQGKLTYSNTSPVNTSVNMTFRIYDVFSGGTELWEENHSNVAVSEGIYDAILGGTTALTLNFSKPYYLGVTVDSDSEMDPRLNLTNSPYTYRAFAAEEADNVTCVNCLTTLQINESTLTIDAETLDTLDSTDFCRSTGANCPAGAGGTQSPWTNNTNEIYPASGYPSDVNVTDDLRVDDNILVGGVIMPKTGDLIISG